MIGKQIVQNKKTRQPPPKKTLWGRLDLREKTIKKKL